MTHILHVIITRCVAHGLHTVVPWTLECACWKQFTGQWGDCENLKLHLSMRSWVLLCMLETVHRAVRRLWKSQIAPFNAIMSIIMHVGDSSQGSEEIVKISNCTFQCDHEYYYACWRQFTGQWGDCKNLKLHLSMRLWVLLSFPALESLEHHSRFLFPNSVLLSFPAFHCLFAVPAHPTASSHNLLQPVPLPEVEMWLPVHKHVTNTEPLRLLVIKLRSA